MTIHLEHLECSQSSRIIWLCEELGVPYEMNMNLRSFKAPKAIEDANPLGQAPVIKDGDITLAESGAIVEYIVHKYGNGRLALTPSDPDYHKYLYWYHFANGTLQPAVTNVFMCWLGGWDDRLFMVKEGHRRLNQYLTLMDKHLSDPANPYLGGREFTAADIMCSFSLTLMRKTYPLDLTPYPHIVTYLKEKIGSRDAYRRAYEKGDPGYPFILDAEPPTQPLFENLTSRGPINYFLMPIRMAKRFFSAMTGTNAASKVDTSTEGLDPPKLRREVDRPQEGQ